MRKYTFSIALILVVAVGFYVISYARAIYWEIQEFDASISSRITLFKRAPVYPEVVKGLYLTAYSAASESKRQQIIDLINETELNAVVIDIKDYTGNILYDSSLPLVDQLATDRDRLKSVRAVINDFKDNGIYVIARQTVFQDPALAEAKPEWAITNVNGGLWRDYKGLTWVDPTKKEVWDYNMMIAQEAFQLGFDELNFDYVRFPSDGPITAARYANLMDDKATTMSAFYDYVKETFNGKRTIVSLDLFGLVLESHDFDLNIGQRLDIALDRVDYIYPMTYPSHYPDGYLGFSNPADFPYEVINNGLKKAEPLVVASETKLRPWLQAFDLGAVYDGAKIRAQINAVEQYDFTAGWMLWNASNRYSSAGLALASEES